MDATDRKLEEAPAIEISPASKVIQEISVPIELEALQKALYAAPEYLEVTEISPGVFEIAGAYRDTTLAVSLAQKFCWEKGNGIRLELGKLRV